MKKLIILLSVILIMTLTACSSKVEPELDYSSFEGHIITSYNDAVLQNENKYIVYYYSAFCSHCVEVKGDILNFFKTFDSLPFYFFNISDASDSSLLEEFVGTPTLFVMSDDTVVESYIGSNNIVTFIAKYQNIELDYDSFLDLQLTTYQEALDIQNETYIIYYYIESNPYCIQVKDAVLEWSYTKSVGDIYLMNGENVINPNDIPDELSILSSATPIILVMSNGEFTGEYYSGSKEVLQYISTIGEGKIINLD